MAFLRPLVLEKQKKKGREMKKFWSIFDKASWPLAFVLAAALLAAAFFFAGCASTRIVTPGVLVEYTFHRGPDGATTTDSTMVTPAMAEFRLKQAKLRREASRLQATPAPLYWRGRWWVWVGGQWRPYYEGRPPHPKSHRF